MYSQELMEQSRERAKEEKERFQTIKKHPTGITGGGSVIAHTVTRTAMRKNMSNLRKDTYIQPLLEYLKEIAPNIGGIIPHPLAWSVVVDEDTCYLHSIDGPDIEAAYTRIKKGEIIHTLIADGKVYVDKDTEVKHKDYGSFGKR